MTGYAAMTFLIAGALGAGYAISGAFFLRFWVRTRDRFFGALAAAFALMAANQVVAAYTQTPRGEDSRAYLLRLAAFLLIILAVLGKSAPAKPPRSE
ncbi:MAG TPA: DUF5985 family protein [Caulobacteraceae bacterium]|nr:DUF5985 family protein [Caulobacteraceae bacterium]